MSRPPVERGTELRLAEKALMNAFDYLVVAGDSLARAGCDDPALKVHEEAAYVATWRNYVDYLIDGEEGERDA